MTIPVHIPFAPLVPEGAHLGGATCPPAALRERIAELHGLSPDHVLPVRGAAHGLEVVVRWIARHKGRVIARSAIPELAVLADWYGVSEGEGEGGRGQAVQVIAAPDLEWGTCPDAQTLIAAASSDPSILTLIDERLIAFARRASLTEAFAQGKAPPHLILMHSLEISHGLAGAPCGALIAHPALVEGLAVFVEPQALPTPVVRLAEAVLHPSRLLAQEDRLAALRAEARRVVMALGSRARETDGPFVLLFPEDPEATLCRFGALGVTGDRLDAATVRLPLFDNGAVQDRALAALGIKGHRPDPRRAEVIRETSETRIVVRIDLDTTGPVRVETGLAFLDHMISQIALHGAFALTLACIGDLEVDTHHTVEDCALALGQALSRALGQRRGLGRYGFVLPMDEAQAQLSIDLGGRPYLVFEGRFAAPLLGAYPTEMTEHFFRSLAQALGAALHIRVTGENDHHTTEACFKALGRALRQALRREGDTIPSSKGVI